MPTTAPPTTTAPGPSSARIPVADAMHDGVLTCTRDTPLTEVAELMARRRVHSVVVTDEPGGPGALWGLVSDLDLVAAAAVRDLGEQTAGGAAATTALTISPEETLQRAAQVMTEHASAHLVVVDETGRPVGVLSTLDVATALVSRVSRSRIGVPADGPRATA